MTDECTFSTSRTLPHPAADVFGAIADADLLARWWGPAGFTNVFSQFEFRVDGRWVFVMRGPDGREFPNQSRFEEIVLNERVVIRHDCAPFFTLTIELGPTAGGTTLRWTQVFDDASTARAVRSVVIPSNEQNLDRLAHTLADRSGHPRSVR